MTNKQIGKYGEDIAKNFLIKKGYSIIEMNYRYSRVAEIDIIAAKNNILHFVEVKTRTQKFYGDPLEAITFKKMKQIFSCAIQYISQVDKKYNGYQIDAIGVVLQNDKVEEIDHIENIAIN